MKRTTLGMLLAASTMTAGCATHVFNPEPGGLPNSRSVVGRWDQVMGLTPSVLVGVLRTDGTVQTGRFGGADADALHLFSQGWDVTFARDEVIRLDLLESRPAGERTVTRIAKGAARHALVMAAVVQVLPLAFSGTLAMPPARFWLVNVGIGGGVAALHDARDRRPRTIYVAPPR